MTTQGLSRAAKLAIACQTVPTLRNGRVRRIVHRVGADGRVVGTIDSLTMAERIHARAGIEFDVVDGARPELSQCKCGTWFAQAPDGPLLVLCDTCADPRCAYTDKADVRCLHHVKRTGNRYCAQHRGGMTGAKPLPQCAFVEQDGGRCPEMATRFSARASRKKGGHGHAYCLRHKGGSAHGCERSSCASCAQPLTATQVVRGARVCSPKCRAIQHRGKRVAEAVAIIDATAAITVDASVLARLNALRDKVQR